MRALLVAVTAAILPLSASAAEAPDFPSEPLPDEAPAAATAAPVIDGAKEPVLFPAPGGTQNTAREWSAGLSAYFHMGGSFLTKPNSAEMATTDGQQTTVDYNGFAGGPAFGWGLSLQGRWKGAVGLEIGLFSATDKGESEILNEDVSVEQSSLHVPILLQGVISGGTVQPMFEFGVDVVMPDAPSAKLGKEVLVCTRVDANGACVGATPGLAVAAHADTYTMIVLGLGFEFVLPTEGFDLRVPLHIRAMVNPSTSAEVADRADLTLDGGAAKVDYLSEFEYHAAIDLGLAWHFF